jgi:hypothetical protein
MGLPQCSKDLNRSATAEMQTRAAPTVAFGPTRTIFAGASARDGPQGAEHEGIFAARRGYAFVEYRECSNS